MAANWLRTGLAWAAVLGMAEAAAAQVGAAAAGCRGAIQVGRGFHGGSVGVACGPVYGGFRGCVPSFGSYYRSRGFGGVGYGWAGIGCGSNFGFGYGYDPYCGSRIWSTTAVVAPVAIGSAGYGYGYDPYLGDLAAENRLLRQQVQQMQRPAAGDVADAANPPRPAARLNVALRQRDAARERQRQALQRARQSLAQGQKMFQVASYRRAAEKFREAADLAPDNAAARFLAAQAMFAAGDYDGAVQDLKDGLKASPDWLEAEFDLVGLYGDADKHPPQLARLAAALQGNPHDADGLFLLGFELFVAGDRAKAKVLLEQAARLTVDDSHLQPFFDYFEKAEKAAAAEKAAVADAAR